MCGPNSTCGEKCMWSVNHEPSASGTCGDVLWNYMSPRMILMNNCMRCNEYQKGQMYNTPYGVQSELAKEHDKNIQDVHKMTYDELLLPTDMNKHFLSTPMSNGIAPLHYDCVQSKIENSSKCGCDNFGKVYNFH